VAHPVAIGPVLTVAANRAVDNPGVDFANRLIIDAQSVNDPGAESLQNDIGLPRQAKKNLLSFRGLKIQRHVLLVAINDIKKESIRQKSFIFNGDHPGAVIGQNH